MKRKDRVSIYNETKLTDKEFNRLNFLIQQLNPGDVITKHKDSGAIKVTTLQSYQDWVKLYGKETLILLAKKDKAKDIQNKSKPIDRKHCPHCGEDNFSFAKYCSGCGYEIPERIFSKDDTCFKKVDTDQEPITYNDKAKLNNDVTSLIDKYGNKAINILLALVLILTNPSKQMHVEFVKDKIYAESYRGENLDGALLAVVELFLGTNTINFLLNSYVERQNYILFSLTVVSYENQTDVLAIGVLGLLIDIKKLNKQIDDYFNK